MAKRLQKYKHSTLNTPVKMRRNLYHTVPLKVQKKIVVLCFFCFSWLLWEVW